MSQGSVCVCVCMNDIHEKNRISYKLARMEGALRANSICVGYTLKTTSSALLRRLLQKM